MHKNEDHDLDLVELGTVSGDTLGDGGPYVELFIGTDRPGLSAD